MTSLEQLAVAAWHRWGEYAKATQCHGCGWFKYCRARRQRGPWLCCDCYDQRQQ